MKAPSVYSGIGSHYPHNAAVGRDWHGQYADAYFDSDHAEAAIGNDSAMTRKWAIYFTLFLIVFGALECGYYLVRNTLVSRLLVDDLTVRPAAAIINVIFPSASAIAKNHSLF